ncbi:MAG: GDCCVxC domain-containing (seleno)protein [Proteobacteria bacterium]|nr:GDCCVxC domain-containing (seleno)protein [Pseudomonadota bacterium]
MRTQATITCQECGHQKTETMPVDACLHFYECENCGTLLRPLPGDCCVFCSFADARCPPQQAAAE